MIHRAPFGSLERMIGLLTEQYSGAFPFWMAPVQIAVLPIADRHLEEAEKLAAKLRSPLSLLGAGGAGGGGLFAECEGRPLRVSVDRRSETLGKKIRDTQLQKVPLMLILGDRDIEQSTVGVRSRDEGDMGSVKLEELFGKVIA